MCVFTADKDRFSNDDNVVVPRSAAAPLVILLPDNEFADREEGREKGRERITKLIGFVLFHGGLRLRVVVVVVRDRVSSASAQLRSTRRFVGSDFFLEGRKGEERSRRRREIRVCYLAATRVTVKATPLDALIE